MRPNRSLFTVLLLCLFISISTLAQKDRYQMYVVHEDHVKEGMMDKHHASDKNLIKVAKEQNIKDMQWLAFETNDNRIMYLTAIDNMAELDNSPFDELQKKLGEDQYKKLFEAYSDTYTKHGNYILRLDHELSYMPGGITQTPEGENYRELTYYHIPPGKSEEAENMARKVKKMYTDKNSKIHYRIYKSGFGNMGNYYMVAVAAKSPEHMEKKREENMKLLGEEGKAMFDKIDEMLADKEVVSGYIRPEISYLDN